MPGDRPDATALESTVSLLDRVREGNAAARDALVRRYLNPLRRWAHGRLPAYARGLADSDDIVQVTLLRALEKVNAFEHRGEGSFLAYLRRILQNQIRDQIRRAARRPAGEPMSEAMAQQGPSPLEQTIGREKLEIYERALRRLSDRQQEAVVMRVELGFSWPEIAKALGSPSPNAARMTVARALARLAETIDG